MVLATSMIAGMRLWVAQKYHLSRKDSALSAGWVKRSWKARRGGWAGGVGLVACEDDCGFAVLDDLSLGQVDSPVAEFADDLAIVRHEDDNGSTLDQLLDRKSVVSAK